MVNSREDKGFRKFCPRWELSLEADSMCHMHRWRHPAEDEGPVRPRGMEEQGAGGGSWSPSPPGNAGMDRGGRDTEN